jgi:quercetin dioxygenase-like cupin family protein
VGWTHDSLRCAPDSHFVGVGPLGAGSTPQLSTYFQPGHFSIVHTHSGPEAWWVLEGEPCLSTATATIRARAGQGAIVEAGETMQMIGVGTGPRRSPVSVLHDAEQPAGTVVDNSPPLKSCK